MESYTTSKHSTNTSSACDTLSIKVDITDTMVLCKMIDYNTSTMLLQSAY